MCREGFQSESTLKEDAEAPVEGKAEVDFYRYIWLYCYQGPLYLDRHERSLHGTWHRRHYAMYMYRVPQYPVLVLFIRDFDCKLRTYINRNRSLMVQPATAHRWLAPTHAGCPKPFPSFSPDPQVPPPGLCICALPHGWCIPNSR